MVTGEHAPRRHGYAEEKFQHSKPKKSAMLETFFLKIQLGSFQNEAPRSNGYAGKHKMMPTSKLMAISAFRTPDLRKFMNV